MFVLKESVLQYIVSNYQQLISIKSLTFVLDQILFPVLLLPTARTMEAGNCLTAMNISSEIV